MRVLLLSLALLSALHGGNVRADEASEPTTEPRLGPAIEMRATTYGPSYEGQRTACGGVYRDADPTIAAVGPSQYREWPCGTRLLVTGPAGTIEVVRSDSCPGCNSYGSPALIDLSGAAHRAVCHSGTCRVTVQEVIEE